MWLHYTPARVSGLLIVGVATESHRISWSERIFLNDQKVSFNGAELTPTKATAQVLDVIKGFVKLFRSTARL
jgi:hypothetical protein